MIKFHRTSLLTSTAQTVVNTVNTVGVMGKGIAFEFKKRYPIMFKEYRILCKEEKLKVGNLWLWKAADQWVLNFPTKIHWRNPSSLQYIESGLQKFVEHYELRGIHEIAFPRLGCGHGGLKWSEVRPLMESYLGPLPIPVYIHDYEVDIGIPEHKLEENGGFIRSFQKFIADIDQVVEKSHGRFRTLSSGTIFHAIFDSEHNLIIKRSSSNRTISNDDLYELWTSLLRGPVTRRKLSGAVRDAAYHLFPVLVSLPYVRLFKMGFPDHTETFALELVDQNPPTPMESSTMDKSGQGRLEWA